MEDFQLRNSIFDAEKYMNNFLVTPLVTSMALDTFKFIPKIENIENSTNIYNNYLKSHLQLADIHALTGNKHEDDFHLDNIPSQKFDETLTNEAINPRKNSITFDNFFDNHPQLNINFYEKQFNPFHLAKHSDQYDKFELYHHVNRSRGPSFNLDLTKAENIESFLNEPDSFFGEAPHSDHKEIHSNNKLHIGESLWQVNQLTAGIQQHQTPSSYNVVVPGNILVNTEPPQSEITKILTDTSIPEKNLSHENIISNKSEKIMKTKKKRKLNNGTELKLNPAVVESIPESANKKPNECKTKVYSISPDTNFLKLKITKLGDIIKQEEDQPINSPTPKKFKNISKTCKKNENNKSNVKNTQEDTKSNTLLEKDILTNRSTEASLSNSSTSSTSSSLLNTNTTTILKVEDNATPSNVNKSKGCVDENQNNNFGLKSCFPSDILNRMQLPSEIEDFLKNSNLFSQIQLQTSRKIGSLTVEERRIKVEKYLLKRKKKTWNKKISYDCRKKVADSRLRIKGRFVTKEQAFAMLGNDVIYDIDKITSDEIKDLLNLKFGSTIAKIKKENSIASKDEPKIKDEISNEGERDFQKQTELIDNDSVKN